MDDVRIYTGTLVADLVLGEARSLKERRGPQRALTQRLKNLDFAVAQVGPADLTQRLFLAVTAVSGEESELADRLDGAERVLFASDFEVADLRRLISVETFPSA